MPIFIAARFPGQRCLYFEKRAEKHQKAGDFSPAI
jgi:hypothetical protein